MTFNLFIDISKIQTEKQNKEDNATSQAKTNIETLQLTTKHDATSTVSETTENTHTSTKPEVSRKSPPTTSSITIDTGKVPSILKTQKVCLNA